MILEGIQDIFEWYMTQTPYRDRKDCDGKNIRNIPWPCWLQRFISKETEWLSSHVIPLMKPGHTAMLYSTRIWESIQFHEGEDPFRLSLIQKDLCQSTFVLNLNISILNASNSDGDRFAWHPLRYIICMCIRIFHSCTILTVYIY